MSLLKFKNVGIAGMSACVPKTVIHNYEYTQYFPEDVVRKVVDKIGIYERRFADERTCSSDLCFAAAEKLIADMEIDRSEIDVLIFISQTGDYRMPATSVLLQERLKLSKSAMVFDLTLGCSAFLYGLTVAYALSAQPNIRKILVLDGETRSKVYSPKDRKTAFLFGDAGIAALIDKDNRYGDSFFSLNADGSMESAIKINGGGYRNPSSEETIQERVVDEYGNIRTDEQGYMDGESVFNFVAREIPRDIKKLCAFAEEDLQQIDYYVFHQANNFMNQFLAKKIKINPEKMPSNLSKYGNTSSVSVPLTIVSELRNDLLEDKKILLSAFGVGLSWGSAILNMSGCKLSEIVEI